MTATAVGASTFAANITWISRTQKASVFSAMPWVLPDEAKRAIRNGIIHVPQPFGGIMARAMPPDERADDQHEQRHVDGIGGTGDLIMEPRNRGKDHIEDALRIGIGQGAADRDWHTCQAP